MKAETAVKMFCIPSKPDYDINSKLIVKVEGMDKFQIYLEIKTKSLCFSIWMELDYINIIFQMTCLEKFKNQPPVNGTLESKFLP